MDWWIIAVGLFVIAAIVTVAKDIIHDRRCKSCCIARKALSTLHPDWLVGGSQHCATESERDIVAVFYRNPVLLKKPDPYVLFAVDTSGKAEMLPDDQCSPYVIRGRK